MVPPSPAVPVWTVFHRQGQARSRVTSGNPAVVARADGEASIRPGRRRSSPLASAWAVRGFPPRGQLAPTSCPPVSDGFRGTPGRWLQPCCRALPGLSNRPRPAIRLARSGAPRDVPPRTSRTKAQEALSPHWSPSEPTPAWALVGGWGKAKAEGPGRVRRTGCSVAWGHPPASLPQGSGPGAPGAWRHTGRRSEPPPAGSVHRSSHSGPMLPPSWLHASAHLRTQGVCRPLVHVSRPGSANRRRTDDITRLAHVDTHSARADQLANCSLQSTTVPMLDS